MKSTFSIPTYLFNSLYIYTLPHSLQSSPDHLRLCIQCATLCTCGLCFSSVSGLLTWNELPLDVQQMFVPTMVFVCTCVWMLNKRIFDLLTCLVIFQIIAIILQEMPFKQLRGALNQTTEVPVDMGNMLGKQLLKSAMPNFNCYVSKALCQKFSCGYILDSILRF